MRTALTRGAAGAAVLGGVLGLVAGAAGCEAVGSGGGWGPLVGRSVGVVGVGAGAGVLGGTGAGAGAGGTGCAGVGVGTGVGEGRGGGAGGGDGGHSQ
ncbi:hypothetical protein ACQEVG_20070 [Streptomyces sp. CA-135486]|uniref:hypothetical protein n=1 Tax=Streptomyces sp. CA-135486 TaxID=3240049 RepID=UPI003D8BC6D0